ncbi:MAG TPA: hypothetical protein VHN12_02505 [Geobacteraceae bacterium]|nr:hypothetical protein [Geobacteraceae bacterium]
MKLPAQPVAFKFETELSLSDPLFRILRINDLIAADVPHRHLSGAIVAFRDGALEGEVVQRMVFGLYGQTLVVWVQRWAFGHGPAFQDAVHFQSQVEVQTPGMVLMDNEAMPASDGAAPATRLRRLIEMPFVPVFLKRLDHSPAIS